MKIMRRILVASTVRRGDSRDGTRGAGRGESVLASPYLYQWENPQNPVTVMQQTGIKAFTLAFVLSNGNCNPAWTAPVADRRGHHPGQPDPRGPVATPSRRSVAGRATSWARPARTRPTSPPRTRR